MPRRSILNADEKAAFDSPPVFNSVERKRLFDTTPRVSEVLKTLRSSTNQVCFLVILGYFKATKRFFARRLRQNDVEYVARQLGFLPEFVAMDEYDEGTFRHHQKLIRDLLGFLNFDHEAKQLVEKEVRSMVRSPRRTD